MILATELVPSAVSEVFSIKRSEKQHAKQRRKLA
jgi:hypothetical protein